MGYGYGRRRRYDPRAEERREREKRERERIERSKRRLARLLAQFKRILLRGQDARDAWGMREVRSFTTAILGEGTHVQYVLRTDGARLYLQQPDAMGWRFYLLVPRYHTYRPDEGEEG